MSFSCKLPLPEEVIIYGEKVERRMLDRDRTAFRFIEAVVGKGGLAAGLYEILFRHVCCLGTTGSLCTEDCPGA